VSQIRHCNRSASAGNYEDIALLLMMYRDIQDVRAGQWERREKFIRA